MKKVFKVLLIDNEPSILEIYEIALNRVSLLINNYTFEIETAKDSETAMQKIVLASKSDGFDIIFLDIKLPPSDDGEILSGEDLGIKINELLPNSKIIISTSYDDNYRIQNLLRNVNPDGFLIKNDTNTEELMNAIINVITAPPYYSRSILKFLRKQISCEFVLDKIDRQLLYEISLGTKMINLPDFIPLSTAALEKRKRHLVEIFNVQGNGDRGLILAAKEKGFI